MAIDIVGFLLTQAPISTWSAAKKQEMLDLFCAARGYQELRDEQDNIIQTKREFVNADVMKYLISICNNEKKRVAKEAVTVEELAV